jgi:hypothetical protein
MAGESSRQTRRPNWTPLCKALAQALNSIFPESVASKDGKLLQRRLLFLSVQLNAILRLLPATESDSKKRQLEDPADFRTLLKDQQAPVLIGKATYGCPAIPVSSVSAEQMLMRAD